MRQMIRNCIATVWLGLFFLFGVVGNANAQQAAKSLRSGYDPAREVHLVGMVTNFVANSDVAPWGAHVTVQTAAGPVDVHVGSAKFLKTNNLTLNPGDNVRIIGENFTNGDGNSVFLARVIQKGTQAVAVRSQRGMPLWLSGSRLQSSVEKKNRGGAQ
jgi:hypothetical protein